MSLDQRVKACRDAKGWSQGDLAQAVTKLGGKLSQQNVANIESGLVKKPGALLYIAQALGVNAPWLLTETGPKEAAVQAMTTDPAIIPAANDTGREPVEDYPEKSHTIGQTAVTKVQQTPGKPDIPLWASAAAGDEGAMILVPDPIDYLRRSERMLNVRNPFGFNILGTSMYPAINHGDQVIINPSIVARPGHDCVFIHEGPDGMLALVKQLLKVRSDQWHVRQFNPMKDFDISRKKWGRIHPIAEIRKAGV